MTEKLAPGIEKPSRFRPRFAWELLSCGLQGHELIGTDVARLGPEDALIARDRDGLRWYRCLRCDSWSPLPLPVNPSRDRLPPRENIELPLRGRPLRDRFVLRLIAVDRIVHFLLIGLLAVALLIFAHDRERLRGSWTRIVNRLQGASGGPLTDTHRGLLHDLDRLFSISSGKLVLYGLLLAGYALINLIEAVGLWSSRRWAEYLTLVEVVVLIPVEIHELVVRISALKILTLLLNLAVVVYLLVAHRLFGVRGGERAYRVERERDTGWQALEHSAPEPAQVG
jgi:uncharacterized membrane protein (DUF2068 family)